VSHTKQNPSSENLTNVIQYTNSRGSKSAVPAWIVHPYVQGLATVLHTHLKSQTVPEYNRFRSPVAIKIFDSPTFCPEIELARRYSTMYTHTHTHTHTIVAGAILSMIQILPVQVFFLGSHPRSLWARGWSACYACISTCRIDYLVRCAHISFARRHTQPTDLVENATRKYFIFLRNSSPKKNRLFYEWILEYSHIKTTLYVRHLWQMVRHLWSLVSTFHHFSFLSLELERNRSHGTRATRNSNLS